MQKNNNLSAFADMPVAKAVISNAVPAMVAMLMVLIYNLADTFFIAQTHDDCQVAAISLAMPVFLLFMSVGVIFGVGGTSVISRAMGEGRPEYGKKVCAFCFWCCIGIAVIMLVVFLVFLDPILRLLGASSDTWDYTKNYLTIVCFGGVFSLINTSFSNIIRADGQAKRAMSGQVVGNLVNIVLDPILILILDLNVVGAAIATVLGNLYGSVYYISYFLTGKSGLSISPRHFTFGDKVFTSVFSIGAPASLAQILMSVTQIIINSLMASYGDMAVAGSGVSMKVVLMTTMVTLGIGQGVQPLLGYCVGARQWKRFKEMLRFSVLFALAISITMSIICYIFTRQIVGVFLTKPEAFDYGVHFARVLLTTCALFGAFSVFLNALQAMGAAVPSLILNISRQGVVCIPCIYLLNHFFGIQGLIWTLPIVDVISTALALVLCIVATNRMMKNSAEAEKAIL